MAKQENGPPKKYDKTLKQCKNEEERVALVRQAMQDGHSNKSAAKALGLGKRFGVIAGIRRKHNIASQHRPSHGTAIEAKPTMLPAPKPEPASPVEHARPKMAASEATQCTGKVNGHQCGYEREPGWTTCMFHHDQEPE